MNTRTVIRVTAAIVTVIALLSGCSGRQNIDPNRDPKLHVDCYEELTALYGTERMATLEALGYAIEDTNVIHGFYIGIPMQIEYAGVTFDIYLHFDNDARLSGVDYKKTYSYPSETEQAIRDVLNIGKQLEQDLGEPAQTDVWNDWYEEEYDVEMDPDPPSYQNADKLRKLVDNDTGGGIMWWDVAAFACPAAKEYITERFGEEGESGFSLNFSPDIDYAHEITVTISY